MAEVGIKRSDGWISGKRTGLKGTGVTLHASRYIEGNDDEE